MLTFDKEQIAEAMRTDILSGGSPQEWRINDDYFKLAYQCVLPAFEALDAGKQDAEALLAVAFSPVTHTVLTCLAPTGVWSVLVLLRRLIGPPHSQAVTHFSTAADFLKRRWGRGRLAVFDLRPGGGAELEDYPYVPLYDCQGQISTICAEALPLVTAVLRGWGMTTMVIHTQPSTELPLAAISVQVQAQWAFLTQQ